MTSVVEAIHVAPEAEAEMEACGSVEAVAGAGLRGDRYFDAGGTFSDVPGGGHDLTLAEAEAIEAVEREAGISLGFDEHRRNVTTRGVALNHLVGRRFRVGDVVCEGVRLCEPCSHLENLTEDGVGDALVHRGGLRADVVEGGEIRVGDDVESIETV
ncbi:MOSC domain-containing protein [Haloplanus sp. GCM10025708]|uniref:MOSC domain-containing protein n=1 Tax=Haloferacaceae TaxID=1644056 RepID=UPI00360C4614